MSADMINVLLTLRNQVKVYHWQTYKYPRHIATDDLTEKLDELIDSFVEVYMGKYGRPKFSGKNSHIVLENFTERHGVKVIDDGIQYLLTVPSKKLDPKKDSDLMNIRDEILAELNKIKYLFTLS